MFEELEVLISAVPFAVSFLIAYILIWSHLVAFRGRITKQTRGEKRTMINLFNFALKYRRLQKEIKEEVKSE